VGSYVACGNKAARVAASAVLVNITIAIGGLSPGSTPLLSSSQGQSQRELLSLLLSLVAQMLSQAESSEEVLRSALALGSLLLGAAGSLTAELSRPMGLPQQIAAAKAQWGERLGPDAKKAVEEVEQVLRDAR
jgi:hypothetical protein